LDGNSEEIKLVNSSVTSPFKLDAATTFTFSAADVGKSNNIEVCGGFTMRGVVHTA
jgi:hypothetical protein